MRRHLLNCPERKQGIIRKPARHQGKNPEKKKALEQQQQDAVLVRAFGSRVSISVDGSQLDHALVFKSAPMYKVSNKGRTTGA